MSCVSRCEKRLGDWDWGACAGLIEGYESQSQQ